MCLVTARAGLSLPCLTENARLTSRDVISSYISTAVLTQFFTGPPSRFPEAPGHATAFVVTPGSQRPSQLQRLGNAASPVVRIQAVEVNASPSWVSCHILSVNAAKGSLCARRSKWCQDLSDKM